jgi:hypothetical protein
MTVTPKERVNVRRSTGGMRGILLAASILVFIAGFQLFILTEHTHRYFAWTINSYLTAAFLGASYWAAGAMEFSAYRQRVWANARVAVPAVLLFTTLTLIVTLWHWDRFHFEHPDLETRIAAWAWLGIYAAVPLLMGALLLRQLRPLGPDPIRREFLPAWIRTVLLLHGLIMMPLGLALLLAPESTAEIWPWALTPLTARAVGAWLLALGVAAVHARWENEWRRVRVASASYAVFGILQFVAVARYPDEMEWGKPAAWGYLAFIASIVAVGAYGWWQSTKVIDD